MEEEKLYKAFEQYIQQAVESYKRETVNPLVRETLEAGDDFFRQFFSPQRAAALIGMLDDGKSPDEITAYGERQIKEWLGCDEEEVEVAREQMMKMVEAFNLWDENFEDEEYFLRVLNCIKYQARDLADSGKRSVLECEPNDKWYQKAWEEPFVKFQHGTGGY